MAKGYSAKDYIDRANGVDDIKETGLTVTEYALDLVDFDIESAISTGEREWLKDLREARRKLKLTH